MNKYAIVTRAKNISEITSISHPILKKYAEKCGADFIVIDKKKINVGPHMHGEIYQIYEMFSKYERILSIDSDVLLSDITPNIFDYVPFNMIGVVLEDKGWRAQMRRLDVKAVEHKIGEIGWKKNYINSGFLIVSKIHKDLFNLLHKDVLTMPGNDDVMLSYDIHRLGFQIMDLGHKFNHMAMHSELGASWLKSYVIHYAGRGFYPHLTKDAQMRMDLETIQNGSKISRHLMHIFYIGIIMIRGIYERVLYQYPLLKKIRVKLI